MTCADGTTLLIRQNILGRNSSRGINYQLDAFPRQLRRQVGIRVFQGCPTRLNLRLNLSLNVWTLTPSIWELSWSWVGVRVESRVGHLWKHPFGRGSPKSPFSPSSFLPTAESDRLLTRLLSVLLSSSCLYGILLLWRDRKVVFGFHFVLISFQPIYLYIYIF